MRDRSAKAGAIVRAAAIGAIASGILASCIGHEPTSKKANSSSTSAAAPSSERAVASAGPFPKVTGDFGDKPQLSFAAGRMPANQLERTVLRKGSGPTIAVGDLLAVDYLGQIWQGASFDNSYDRKTATTVQIGIGKVIKGWDTALVGMKVGSRVELSIPPSLGYGSAGNTQAKIKATDTLVFVIDIGRRYNIHSTADPTAALQAEPAGAPKVSGVLNAAPDIAIEKGSKPPSTKHTYVLARGAGAAVENGTVVVQYRAVDWTGADVGSTWVNGTATSVPVGNSAASTGGLFDSLAGVPIGSRVLITSPAAAGDPPLTGSSAVVVDIVDQVTTAKAMAAQA